MKTLEFTVQAFITLSNCGGIEIMLYNCGDGVCYRFNYGQDNLEQEEIFESEVLYSNNEERDGEAYFLHGEAEYYLSEAIRVN